MNKILVFLLVLFSACQSPSQDRQEKTGYPDLKDFFKQEIERLNKSQPIVDKEVRLNDQEEHKTVSKVNWTYELELFPNSDINKPAFKGLYRVSKSGNTEIYTARNAELRTQEIKIFRNATGQIEKLTIRNFSQNLLYTTDERLEYCPNVSYQIVKRQQVLVLGKNDYQIGGKFKK